MRAERDRAPPALFHAGFLGARRPQFLLILSSPFPGSLYSRLVHVEGDEVSIQIQDTPGCLQVGEPFQRGSGGHHSPAAGELGRRSPHPAVAGATLPAVRFSALCKQAALEAQQPISPWLKGIKLQRRCSSWLESRGLADLCLLKTMCLPRSTYCRRLH